MNNNKLYRFLEEVRGYMKSKFVFILLIIVVILGLGIGVVFNIRNNASQKQFETITPDEDVSDDQVLDDTEETVATETMPATPTFPPLSEEVKSIDVDRVTIVGKNGEMTIPKNPSMVKVYKRSGDRLISSSFDELKIGQKVTLKILKPGKEAELIIE